MQRSSALFILSLILLFSLVVGPVPLSRAQQPNDCPPLNLAEITPDNADQVIEVARWGRGAAFSSAWSPDGSIHAVGSALGVWLFDTTDPEADPLLIEDQGDRIETLVFTPDGTALVTGATNGIRVWDAATGDLLNDTLAGYSNYASALSFSNQGAFLYGQRYGELIKWQVLPNKSLMEAYRLDISRTRDFGVDAADSVLVTLTGDGATIRNAATGTERMTITQATLGIEADLRSVAVSPAGDLMALGTGRPEYRIALWSLPAEGDPQQLLTIDRESTLMTLAFSPDGSMLAAADSAGNVQVWSVFGSGESLSLLPEIFFDMGNEVQKLGFSPPGNVVTAVTIDNVFQSWDVLTGEALPTPAGFGDKTRAAFRPDGQQVAILGGDHDAGSNVQLVDLTTCEVVGSLPTQANMLLYHMAYSPDGAVLATGGQNAVYLWDTASGELLANWQDVRYVNALDFSPDGTMLAAIGGLFSSSSAGTWDMQTMAPITDWTPHDGSGRAIAFNPAGNMLATGGTDFLVNLWDPATGEPAGSWEGHEDDVLAMTYNSDGRILVTGDWMHAVKLWNPANGVVRLEFNTPLFVRTMDLSPADTVLAIGGRHSAIELWDTFAGSKLVRLDLAYGDVRNVMFSPDGRLLVSAGEDGTIRFWGVPAK